MATTLNERSYLPVLFWHFGTMPEYRLGMLLPLVLLVGFSGPKFPMTIESIMRGPALIGHAPRILQWSTDGTEIKFMWGKANGDSDPISKTFIVKRDGTGLAPVGTRPFAEAPYQFPESKPSENTTYLSDGDVFIKGAIDKVGRKLTHSTDTKENPEIAGEYVVYLKGGNLYRVSFKGDAPLKLTDFKSADEAPITSNASELALAAEETELFKTYPPSGRPTPTATSRRGSTPRSHSFELSPDHNHAVITLGRSAVPGKAADVPNYVTPSGYPEMIPGYQPVGGPQSQSHVVVIDIPNAKVVDIAPPKVGRVNELAWSADGRYGSTWAESEDHKDAWLMLFDSVTDKVTVLWNEHDDAWVGGPGRGLLGWLPDSKHVYFESEAKGFANLETVDVTTGEAKNLTEGDFEVSHLTVDKVRNRFIFVSSEGSPFRRHIDTVDFDGGPRKKLADYSADEDANFAIAPNGVDIAVVRSRPNHPAELFVNNVQVTETPSEEWRSYPWIDPTVVMVPARDGASVAARLYKPKRWRRGGPAVIFVHGAGYLQNVYEGWSHYFREYMFHNYLVEHGYAVLDMDYRASAGYGKAWRTGIYRHMGGKDLDDNVDGANWLIKNLGVAKNRIGIYGGSYGGFITLMAMFTTPDVFAAGAALRPVSDWANYNHGYTSEILNLPQNDKEAYRISSPIFHAEGLKGQLLICHGMVDVNVHYQDTVRLIERLIELRKTTWSVAPYPVEDHGFVLPESWTDEYRRIYELFERTIGSGYHRR